MHRGVLLVVRHEAGVVSPLWQEAGHYASGGGCSGGKEAPIEKSLGGKEPSARNGAVTGDIHRELRRSYDRESTVQWCSGVCREVSLVGRSFGRGHAV